MITVYWWKRGEHKGVWLDGDQFRARQALLKNPEDTLWIDLNRPTAEEVAFVYEDFFHVHPLTLEDATRPERDPNGPPHLPKVEEFPDYLFVVTNPTAPNLIRSLQSRAVELDAPKRPPFGRRPEPAPTGVRSANQLTAVLTARLLITHHYEQADGIDALRGHLNRHEASCERGPDYLFHIVLDAMVDQYAPVLDHFHEALDEVEAKVFTSPTRRLLTRMLQLKRQIIGMRKTVVYAREVLARLSRGEFELIGEREVVYYRNVHDHLVRFAELLEGSREMVSDLLQTHLAAVSNRLNEIMKVLAMISTVILPMTLIAGIYGMNYQLWPDNEGPAKAWGFWFAIGLMLVSASAAVGYFKWKKWF
jgi:magnesium transporter